MCQKNGSHLVGAMVKNSHIKKTLVVFLAVAIAFIAVAKIYSLYRESTLLLLVIEEGSFQTIPDFIEVVDVKKENYDILFYRVSVHLKGDPEDLKGWLSLQNAPTQNQASNISVRIVENNLYIDAEFSDK